MGKEKEKGKGQGGRGDKSGTGHRGEMEEKEDEKIQGLRASTDDGKTDENGGDWADAADLENASTDVTPSSSSEFFLKKFCRTGTLMLGDIVCFEMIGNLTGVTVPLDRE